MVSERGVSSAAGPPITVLVVGGPVSLDGGPAGRNRITTLELDEAEGMARLATDAEDIDCVVVAGREERAVLERLEAARRAAPGLPRLLVVEGQAVRQDRARDAGATEIVRADRCDRLDIRIRSLVSDPPDDRPEGFEPARLARLARLAIANGPTAELMDEAVAVVDASLDGRYAAIHRLDAEAETMTLRWGRGWPDGIGDATVGLHEPHQLAYTVAHGGPVVVADIETDERFDRIGVPTDAVRGAVTARIGAHDDPYGVLGVYWPEPDGLPADAGRLVRSVASMLSIALDQRQRLAELERYERIVETIDDGIYTLDDEFRITWVNQAAVSMLGYPREELLGSHALMLTSEETIDEAARISQELLDGERTVGRLDTELRTADGDAVPIETQFTMLPLGDDRYGQVGVFRDITARKEYERVLTALHDSTRELVRAETVADVVDVIQETATGLLDLSTAVYLFDDDANVLRPEAVASAAEGAFDPLHPIGPADDTPAWRAFVGQERVVTPGGQRDADEEVWYFPLGTHGVFAAIAPGEPGFDTETSHLAGLLAANTEAALDRIDREAELRERERDRQAQTRRLKQLNRVNEIIRGIDQSLVRAETREEIEQAVCERLVEDERCAFVWIGAASPGDDDIVPRTWAGPENGYLDEVSITATPDASEPTARAAVDREAVTVTNVAEGFRDAAWRRAALSRDYLSVMSVPLAYGELFYGVLTVYANEVGAFDETSEAVLGELGETIAYAINSLETKQSLLTDRSIELDLRFAAEDDLLCRMAAAADCRLEFREFMPRAGGVSTVVFAAEREAAERISALDESFVAVDAVRHVTDREDRAVFEATIRTPAVAQAIKEYGAKLRSIVADDVESRAVVELSREADVRSFVETLNRLLPETELVGRRNRNRSVESRDEFRTDLESALTDRQLEVVRAAFRNGYFEWPREHTGEEVASRLDISQPTFNRHLRESERKLFTLLFGDDR